MATVPMIAMGITLSGFSTSNAIWVAQSRHENDQAGLIKPTIKAIPPFFQPVSLLNVAKTNFASLNFP